MIKVVHYDYARMFNGDVLDNLKKEFSKYQDIDYEILDTIHVFNKNNKILTRKLEKSDFFLVHPGTTHQPNVINYIKNFENLQTIFLVPKVSFYHCHENISIFGWEDTKEVVDYIINHK